MRVEEIQTALRNAGLVADCDLVPLNVTGNNRVFRVDSLDKQFLLKEYTRPPGDTRDRFHTEQVFYSYLKELGNPQTPEAIAWFKEERLACFEFIKGTKPVIATRELMDFALRFLFAINPPNPPASAGNIPAASEACFSISEHIECIDRRVERLQSIEPLSEFHEAAMEFAQKEIRPKWNSVRLSLENRAFPALTPEKRCVSPSDFGFHNAIIRTDGTPRFFDFEYAGWDDPAKTVCDFFCQPTVPVPVEWLSDFVAPMSAVFRSEGFEDRVGLLLPAYQIKWCCIILNDFLPTGAHRRNFSNPTMDRTQRLREQVDKCVRFFQSHFR